MNIFEITPDLQQKIDDIIFWYGKLDPTLDVNKVVKKAIEKYYTIVRIPMLIGAMNLNPITLLVIGII